MGAIIFVGHFIINVIGREIDKSHRLIALGRVENEGSRYVWFGFSI